MKLLYISSSQFSGSTLASFLLNLHPGITTVGHTTGWQFAPGEDFKCSCGESLEQCPFYARIAAAFAAQGLPFDIRNFGTAYRVSGIDRINRYLTAGLPFGETSALERLRDACVRRLPVLSARLARQDLANLTFICTALEQAGSRVFLDNSHDPYRLRHLSRIEGLEILNMHLIRDPRGVALSMMTHHGWSAALAAQLWLRRQRDATRLAEEFRTITVKYEDLCTEADRTLGEVHEALALQPLPFTGDFKSEEHHILGNTMRLRSGELRLDTRWRRDLAPEHRTVIERHLADFVHRHRNHPLNPTLQHYLSLD